MAGLVTPYGTYPHRMRTMMAAHHVQDAPGSSSNMFIPADT